MSAMLTKALESVLAERQRQDEKWGVSNHAMIIWLAILMEEIGELSQETLGLTFDNRKTDGLRKEAVQVAAVALAIVESLDRNGLK